ncbi:MAG: hypothetical protein H6662_19375 [Ardenticatenaceae bacterium]|nr:hypothetical protein [Anaerolineales bacterium]MCB8923747.1 hypothetical protein [Ardenticatenaceae bacterium]MCB8990082.1 hypothetical protein [Ardenticatenaceae bacterium]
MAQMQNPKQENDLRFMTKSIGFLAVLTGLAYLRAVGMEGLADWRAGERTSSLLLFVFLLVATAGLLIAWFHEGAGGVVSVVSAVGAGILAFAVGEQNRLFEAFAYSSPFLITGLMFLVCWWRQRVVNSGQ